MELRMKTQLSSPDPESGIGFVSVFLPKELSTIRWWVLVNVWKDSWMLLTRLRSHFFPARGVCQLPTFFFAWTHLPPSDFCGHCHTADSRRWLAACTWVRLCATSSSISLREGCSSAAAYQNASRRGESLKPSSCLRSRGKDGDLGRRWDHVLFFPFMNGQAYRFPWLLWGQHVAHIGLLTVSDPFLTDTPQKNHAGYGKRPWKVVLLSLNWISGLVGCEFPLSLV